MTGSRLTRSLRMGAAFFFLLSWTLLSCGGAKVPEPFEILVEARPEGNLFFFHGHPVPADAPVKIEWSRAGGLRIDSVPYLMDDPQWERREFPEFDRVHRRMSGAYVDARGRGASEDEATAAAIDALREEDRALLAAEPTGSGGIVEIRFEGQPPEVWVLRSEGRGGMARDRLTRDEARKVAEEIAACLQSEEIRTITLIGEKVYLYTEFADVNRASAQLAPGGEEDNPREGPIPTVELERIKKARRL